MGVARMSANTRPMTGSATSGFVVSAVPHVASLMRLLALRWMHVTRCASRGSAAANTKRQRFGRYCIAGEENLR